jgi:hypothetical protein
MAIAYTDAIATQIPRTIETVESGAAPFQATQGAKEKRRKDKEWRLTCGVMPLCLCSFVSCKTACGLAPRLALPLGQAIECNIKVCPDE